MRPWLGAVLLGAAAAGVVAVALLGGEESAPEPPPVSSLLRDGTTEVATRTADLDGDGVPEVVLSSVGEALDEFSLPPPYLDVFAHRDGGWRRVLDATEPAPPGAEAPAQILRTAEPGFLSSESISLVETVDFEGRGSHHLVVTVSTRGATAGPVELWVMAMEPGGTFRTEVYSSSERGGVVHVGADEVEFEFPVYRRDDPGCCPSLTERVLIGFDPQEDRVRILHRDRDPSDQDLER